MADQQNPLKKDVPLTHPASVERVDKRIRTRLAAFSNFENAGGMLHIAVWCILAILFTAIAIVLPGNALSAFDWNTFFEQAKNIPPFYPPWTAIIVSRMNYPWLIGITLATFSVAVMRRTQSWLHGLIAFLNLPLFWTLFLGQLDGLALLGVIGLPWLLPLVFLKPQIAFFAIFSRKKAILFAAVFLLATFLIWNLWPIHMLSYHRIDADNWPQDIALNLLGIPLFLLILIIMPKDDVDWWMLAGATVTPFLLPYNLLPLMPAIARLTTGWALTASLASWLPLLANWFGPLGWKLNWLSVGAIALGLIAEGGTTSPVKDVSSYWRKLLERWRVRRSTDSS